MLAQFVADHAGVFVVTGIGLGIAGGLWFLFAAYGCDVSLARWTLLFPPLALLFVFRYPETCLRPFLLSLLAVGLIAVGCFSSLFEPIKDPVGPDLQTVSP